MGESSVRRGVGLLLAALMLLPAVVAIAVLAGRPWKPVDDFAIIDLLVRDVWSAHIPLTGLFSRPGWNHPGPAMFWLMAPLSAVTGNAPWATRIGGPILQAVALGWLAWVTWRRGLTTLLAAATVTALTCLAVGPEVFRQTWNLHVPLPYFILFLFLTTFVASGSFRQLIAMSLVGSLIVQTHIGYTLLIAVGFAWAIGWTLIDARRTHRAPERWRATALISIAVWVVSWIPPVVDTVVNWPGNLSRVGRYFLTGDYSHVGFGPAAGLVATEFSFVPPWLGGKDLLNPFTAFASPSSIAWLLVPCGLVGLGLLAARQSGSRMTARSVGFAATMVVAGILAISRSDEPRAYTFQWRVVIAAFLVVVCVWAIGEAVAPRVPRAVRVATFAAFVTLVAWGTMTRATSLTADTGLLLEERTAALTRVMSQLEQRGLPRNREILVQAYGSSLHSLFDGVVNELDRENVNVRVVPSLGRVFGSHRVGQPRDADETWYVTEQGSRVAELLALPGAHLIATTTPLSSVEDAELTRLQSMLEAQLQRAGRPDMREFLDQPLVPTFLAQVPGIDLRAADRVGMLNAAVVRANGCRCAVVAVPNSRERAPDPTHKRAGDL